MTVVRVDMHRFALMWLVYSGNKFFRVGPNISENPFRGKPILGGPKRDMPVVKFHTHTPSVASFAVFLDRNINSRTASDEEIWQRGYGGRLLFLAQYRFLHRRAWPQSKATMQADSVANFASVVGACTGIVEPFKHLLRANAHPHFFQA